MSNNTIAVNKSNFQKEVMDSSIPVVIDFWAPWCGPCRSIGPILEEMAGKHEGDVKVVKVNVDEEPSLAQQFEVRGIPTLAVVQQGEVTSTEVGFRGRDALVSLFDQLAG